MSKSRPGPPSSLSSFFKARVIKDGEVLRYKDKTGTLMLVGRAREEGIEVQGDSKPLKYAAWEELAGSLDKKAMENTYTASGTSLQEEQGKLKAAANRTRSGEEPVIIPMDLLLDDENDEFCYICGLGGDLMCCETCPGTYHMSCMGLTALPTDDWYCPACRCTQCGKGAFDASYSPLLGTVLKMPSSSLGKPPGPPLKLSYVSQDAPLKTEANGVSAAAAGGGKGGGAAGVPTATATGTAALHLGTTSLPDAVSLPKALQGDALVSIRPSSASKNGAKKRTKSVVPPAAQVRCCVTGMCAHYSCLPADARAAVAAAPDLSQWMCSSQLVRQGRHLAELCSKGALPFLALEDGTQLSLQIIRGAAVAGTAHAGPAPAYSPIQRGDLRRTLSAALLVLRSAYTSFPDSRTGGDLLAWMVRGARFADGAADFSGMHTAVLFANSSIVGAACFRLVGPEAAEIPVLAIRPEFRGCGMGGLFISRIEIILAAVAGVRYTVTPAFTPWKHVYMPAVMPNDAPLMQPAQEAWGYSLATPKEMQALVTHRLVRMPGVLLAVKALSDVRLPRPLPASLTLNPAADAKQLVREGFIKPMQDPAAASAAAAALSGGAGAGILGGAGGGSGGGVERPRSVQGVASGGSPSRPRGRPRIHNINNTVSGGGGSERSHSMQGVASGGTPHSSRPRGRPRKIPLESPVERVNGVSQNGLSFFSSYQRDEGEEREELGEDRPAKQPRVASRNGGRGSSLSQRATSMSMSEGMELQGQQLPITRPNYLVYDEEEDEEWPDPVPFPANLPSLTDCLVSSIRRTRQGLQS